MNTIKELAALLRNTPSGSVQGEKLTEVVNTLQECWHEFEGSTDNKMAAYKLERVENMTWHPPVLSFDIERHGAMARGSTRAEIQQWELDLEKKTANCSVIGKRQLTSASTAPGREIYRGASLSRGPARTWIQFGPGYPGYGHLEK